LDLTWEPPRKLYLTLAEASKLHVRAMALFFYYIARGSFGLGVLSLAPAFPV
jgi:hypothetical protein